MPLLVWGAMGFFVAAEWFAPAAIVMAQTPPAGPSARTTPRPRTLDFSPAQTPVQMAQQPEFLRPGAPAPQGPPGGSGTLPAPPGSDVFGPDQQRLSQLGEGAVGTTPQPTPFVLQQFNQYVERAIDPENTLDLVLGRPRLLILKQTPVRVQIADNNIADFDNITEREYSIVPVAVGSTVLNFWFTDPAEPNRQKVLSYLLRVMPDPEAKDRLERVYAALEKEINENFPNSAVKLSLVGDKVVVQGEAKDIVEASQILQVVGANTPGGQQPQQQQNPLGGALAQNIPNAGNVNLIATPGELSQLPELSIENYILSSNARVINLLRVPGEHQVMLRVTVAEVNRSAARSIGLNFSLANQAGLNVFRQITGPIANANLPTLLDNGQVNLAIRALRTLDLARSLAEPNLVTTNGQAAAFLAGGQFPVPAGQAAFGAAAQGVAFVPFGVQLMFTPYITDKDRIRLVMVSTVSTRNEALATNVAGSNVPGLNSRTFRTTVELREGQTLAVAGLIQNNFGATSNRVPFWGDLPLLGFTGGTNNTTAAEQELVILVTPELVHPLDACHGPQLPGTDVIEPGDIEFYLLNRLEGRRAVDNRSPVRTDLRRQLNYEHCEDLFIIGAQGQAYGCCPPKGDCP